MTELRRALVQNHLLSLLPDDEAEEIASHVEAVELDFRDLAYDVNHPIRYAYFPEDCVISIVGVMRDGAGVEVATVGNEGMIGLPLFLDADRALGQAFAQVAGEAFRMDAAAFREASSHGMFHDVMRHYTQALFTQISQSAACNRVHLTEERFARWLLMTHDRVGRDDFTLTQDFLSQMLGVRRATVSEIAAEVQKQGIIAYTRGHMTIVDRERLEALSCECYPIIRAEFERLLGRPRGNPRLHMRAPMPPLSEGGKSTAGDGTPRDEHEHC